MQVNKKWLLAAPALGAVLVLGPMAQKRGPAQNSGPLPAASLMEPAGAKAEPQPRAPSTTAKPAAKGGIEVGSNTVSMPEPWQVFSTLAGLLILAGIAVLVLGRVRKNPRRPTSSILALRQTLRLGSKSKVHAVQFDDRLLLLGESDSGVTLLQEIENPEVKADEDEVLDRYLSDHEDATSEGAEPKDLGLIAAARQLAASRMAAQQEAQAEARRKPTPSKAQPAGGASSKRKAAPRKPTTQQGAKPVVIPRPDQAATTAQAKGSSTREDALSDFRALLRRAKAERVS